MPTPHDVHFFETATQLRAWFEANHESAAELWVGYHLKSTGRPSVTWKEVVDQVLCFGWIDSVRYGLGGGQSAQRLTPRRKRSIWSAINVRRFQELEAMGLVHPAGRAAFEARDPARTGVYSFENRSELSAEQEALFRSHPSAWDFFQEQAPWYRRVAIHWVVSAKQEATRERRLSALIECSASGERLPAFSRP